MYHCLVQFDIVTVKQMWYCVIIIKSDVTCFFVRKLKTNLICCSMKWNVLLNSDISTGQGFEKRAKFLFCFRPDAACQQKQNQISSICVCVCVCMCVCVYIYIYIHTHTHVRGNVLQPHISPHKHWISSHALSIHCSQFPVTVHRNTCIYLLDTLEQCLANGLFCTSYNTLYLWLNHNQSLVMRHLWSGVWRVLLWGKAETGHVGVKWSTAGCWCCMRWAVCGVECGESCCEARWPLAMWVLSDPLPAADVAWDGPFVEWSVERVAVRQGGHWPCGC